MQAQSYQGYYTAGNFRTLDGIPVPRQGDAVLVFIDRTPLKDNNEQLAAFDEFMASIHGSGEEVPEFERARLHREVDL